ncbi:efflux RND transporter periplasmic adaptor subunit [Synechocystis salina]
MPMAMPLVQSMKKPLPILLGLLGLGILVVGIFAYRSAYGPSRQSELDKYTVMATESPLEVEIKASGTVQPQQTVNISPKAPGRLLRLFVEQGDVVKKGDRIAVMENQEFFADGKQSEARLQEAIARYEQARIRIPAEIDQLRAQVNQGRTRIAQARSQLASAQARLEQAQSRIPSNIDQLRAQVASAESRLKLAENRRNRNQSLLQEGAITQDQYDELSNEFLNAQASLFEAQSRLNNAKTTASPEVGQIEQEIIQLQGAIAEAEQGLVDQMSQLQQRQATAETELATLQAAASQAEAQLLRSKIAYEDTFILAPFDGIITQKFATVGSFVTPTTSASSTASATSTSIVALAQGLEVVARVPEVDISALRPGQMVDIVADAFPNEVFTGRVIRVAPEAIVENNVTSFEVTIGLTTGQGQLRSKMNVDVVFKGDRLTDALTVPTVAIVTVGGRTGVMVPDAEDKPQFKPVTIGLVLDDKTQILRGLGPRERVFIDLPEGSEDALKPPEDSNESGN